MEKGFGNDFCKRRRGGQGLLRPPGLPGVLAWIFLTASLFLLKQPLLWRALSKSRLGEAAWAAVCEGLRANPKAREPLEAPKDSPDYDKARVFAA